MKLQKIKPEDIIRENADLGTVRLSIQEVSPRENKPPYVTARVDCYCAELKRVFTIYAPAVDIRDKDEFIDICIPALKANIEIAKSDPASRQ